VWNTHCAEILPDDGKQVLMIRHGQSTWNAILQEYHNLPVIFGLFMGKDAPLSKLGLYQAQRLARILRKAHAKVYPSDSDETEDATLAAARADLEKVNLEEEATITHADTKKLVTDEEMVENLASEKNRLELDVLLGRKCEETNFVASPLARAMDTLLIGTMERNLRCSTPWKVSSYLAEIEHNLDCEPNLQPGDPPQLAETQNSEYAKAGINDTKKQIAALYSKADASGHTSIKSSINRLRLWDQSPEMILELDKTFSSPKKFSVWGGHSIWFRVFFQYFADQSDKSCQPLAKMKVANTAVVSVQLRRLKDSPRKYVAIGCKFIHLGSDKAYKLGKKKKATEEKKAAKEEAAAKSEPAAKVQQEEM
jgi:broad specificity phosphatase PhoE